MSIAFVVPGQPVSVNRAYAPARWGKRHGMILTPEGQAFKTRVALAARKAHIAAGCPPFPHAEVRVTYWFRTLGSDVDGPNKLLLDAIEMAGVYRNDRLVVKLTAEKRKDAENPRAEVEVREAQP